MMTTKIEKKRNIGNKVNNSERELNRMEFLSTYGFSLIKMTTNLFEFFIFIAMEVQIMNLSNRRLNIFSLRT